MTRMVDIRVVVKGPNFEKHFMVEVAPNVLFHELKNDLVQLLADGKQWDADQFTLNVEGTYLEPIIVLTMQ